MLHVTQQQFWYAGL